MEWLSLQINKIILFYSLIFTPGSCIIAYLYFFLHSSDFNFYTPALKSIRHFANDWRGFTGNGFFVT